MQLTKKRMFNGTMGRLSNWAQTRRRNQPTTLSHWMEKLAYRTTVWAGSSWAFMLAAGLTITWLISGPFFHYSDTWQLVMNTISSIVTFLMVFLIQRSQNKESLAMQIKLNEIVGALQGASNRIINVENLSEEEVRELHQHYEELARRAEARGKTTQRLSIEQTKGRDQMPQRPTTEH